MIKLRALFWTALLCTVFASATIASATPVLLANPGFEGAYVPLTGAVGRIGGQIAPGWSDDSEWAQVTGVYGAAVAGPHGGARAQQINVTSITDGAMQIVQSVPVKKGHYYTARFWLRGAPGTRVVIQLQRATAPYESLISNEITLTGAWTEYSAKGYVTESTAALLMVRAQTAGVVVIDDASLDETPSVARPAPPRTPVSARFFGMHLVNFQTQTLRNPGLEGVASTVVSSGAATLSGPVVNGWEDNSGWANVSTRYSIDLASPHGGRQAQKVEVLAVRSGESQFVQDIAVLRQKSYTFSAWLRGGAGQTVSLVLMNGSAPYNSYATRRVTLTSSWTQASVTGTVTDSGLPMRVMIGADGPATYSVDDARVTDAAGRPVSGGYPWPSAPVGTIRLWDSGTTWARLEPQRGQWDFSTLDFFVAAAQAHGNPDIILTLGQSPRWASARPNEVSYNGAGAPAEPASLADWTNYVRTLALRYRGKIRYWEIWNEPNDPTFYTGTPQKLVELTNYARAALKSVDPANVVLAPAPYSVGYVDQFLALGGGALVDVITFHSYRTPPEGTAADLANLRRLLSERGIAKPLWDTESASGDTNTSASLAPALLARKYLVDLTYGAERFNWYSWGPATSFCVATMSSTGAHAATAAGVALGILQGWLVGTTIVSTTTDAGGTWRIGLTRPGKGPAAIVWNPDRNVTTILPGALSATRRSNLDGSVATVSGTTVTATPTPVLYE